MTDTLHYGPAAETDVPTLARLMHEAFAGPLNRSEEWVRLHAFDNIRVTRGAPGGLPESCLFRIPMGMHFGGRSVPMVGVAGVAADPTKRGQGSGRRMMERCVQEIGEAGVAVSGLYASTRPLYRQVGYEAAGGRYEHELPIDRLPKFRTDLTIRRLTSEDQPQMTRCYSAFASQQNGTLDRGSYIWARVWKNRGEPYHAFGAVNRDGDLEGYVLLTQQPPPGFGKHNVILSDFAATSAQGVRALSTFLAGYTTMGDKVVYFGGPTHPLFTLLPHQWGTIRVFEPWMLRVTNVAAALEHRGYDPGVRARITLDVHDETIPMNTGTWGVEVEDGRARVTKGATAGESLRTDARGLAAIYSGYLTPQDAALSGMCEASPAALAAARSVFAGPSPWMSDFF